MGRSGRALSLSDGLRAGLAAAILVSLPMCARPGRPPGGPRDLLPPQVVETSPEAETQIEDSGDEVVITFNERISERVTEGTFEQAVIVSPEVEGLEVRHRSKGIVLKAPDGWGDRRAYSVRVLPVIQDLFQNRMAGPFEFAFGSGIFIPRGTIAGLVSDRITGLPVAGVRVTALPDALGREPPLYLTRTDSLGIFAFRRVFVSGYEIQAFTDANRNREPDPFEAIGGGQAAITRQQGDTAIVLMTILRPDTTPAVVGRVEVAEFGTLKVTLDDFVAQEDPLSGVTVTLSSDSVAAPGVAAVVHDGEYQDTIRARQGVANAAAAAARAAEAAAAADSTGAEDVEPGPPPPDPVAPDTTGQDPGPPPPLLPQQAFYVLLADTLAFDVEYVVRIEGVTNINGLGAGEGTDTIIRFTPPPPPPDTTQAPPDTAQAPPDTAQAPPDTAQAPPDTGRVHRR